MIVLTDMDRNAAPFFGLDPPGGGADTIETATPEAAKSVPGDTAAVARALFDRNAPGLVELKKYRLPGRFGPVLLQDRPRRSNMDVLTEMHRKGAAIPDGFVCAARTGRGFLGRFDRSWATEPGNLHAVIHLTPRITPQRAGASFSILAAAACVNTITESLGTAAGQGKIPRIKWVNDIFIDKKKIAGILTRQTYEDPVITNVFLGTGVNVLTAPRFDKDPFVPAAGSLAGIFPENEWSPGAFLIRFLDKLDIWYGRLLSKGPGPLLDFYRSHSSILGRPVRVYEDGFGFGERAADRGNSFSGRKLLARGVVKAILDDLSLEITGCPKPIGSGRLALEEDCQ